MKPNLINLLVVVMIIAFAACSPKTASEIKSYKKVDVGYGEQKSTETTTPIGTINPNEDNPTVLTLADMLRRTPGIAITGQHPDITIQVRGTSTIEGYKNPLFVIDGLPIGNDYGYAVQSVEVNDIKSVSVLRGSDATMYGSRGSSGVVLIKTRKK